MKYKYQKGVVELAVILIIVAGIAVAGYLVLRPAFTNSDAALTPQRPVVSPTRVPSGNPTAFPANDVTSQVPAITNKTDLSNRLKELDNTNVDEVTKKLFENDADLNRL